MEQKDKELLIKDLCGRLPYETKVSMNYGFGQPEIKKLCFIHISQLIGNQSTSKPYLRPMSTMTGDEMREIEQMNNNSIQHIDTVGVRFQAFYDTCYNEMYDLFDYLNAHHFDYRGLIEKGLALVAPDGMYDN